MKTEAKTREELFKYAKKVGAERDLEHLFNKWDQLIALAPERERVDMARTAILEVQTLLDIHPETGDGLTINGEVVIDAAAEGKEFVPWGKIR